MLCVHNLWLIFLVSGTFSSPVVDSPQDNLNHAKFTPAENVNMTWLAEIDQVVPYDVSFYYPSPFSEEVFGNQDVVEYTRNIHKSVLCPIYKRINSQPKPAMKANSTQSFDQSNGTYYADRFGGTKMPIVLTDNHSYFVGVIITSAVEFPILIKSRLIKDLPQDVEDKIDRKIAELHFNKKPISVINSQKDC